jgi:hypothetical protein
MTRVVILGEIYNADLSIGGGPIYLPPGSPSHPWVPPSPPGYWGGVAPPLPTHPIAPGGPPPGYWGGVAPPRPDQGLPGVPPGFWGGVAPPYPDQGLPGAPPGYWGGVAPPYPDQGLPPVGTPVPPEQLPPPEVPPELASQVIVSVYKPNEGWTTKSYPPR